MAKRTQHVAPNNVAICCVGLLRSFGQGLIKRSSERFVDLFSERIKFSRDKYVVLRVRCYEYVREALKSEEATKLFTIVAKMVILADIVQSVAFFRSGM